jgi:hypothetical protein
MDLMDKGLAKRTTPVAAMRALMGPYREKMERSDAARAKFEGRLRRDFDLYSEEMREIWQDAGDLDTAPVNGQAESTSEPLAS